MIDEDHNKTEAKMRYEIKKIQNAYIVKQIHFTVDDPNHTACGSEWSFADFASASAFLAEKLCSEK